jgi:hypothetical protein
MDPDGSEAHAGEEEDRVVHHGLVGGQKVAVDEDEADEVLSVEGDAGEGGGGMEPGEPGEEVRGGREEGGEDEEGGHLVSFLAFEGGRGLRDGFFLVTGC